MDAKKIFGNIDFSDQKAVKKRYRNLAKRYHTDANGDTQKMIQLNQAKDLIDSYCDKLKTIKQKDKREEKIFNQIYYYKDKLKKLDAEIGEHSKTISCLQKEIEYLKDDWYCNITPTEKLAMKMYHRLFDHLSFLQRIVKHMAIFLTISLLLTLLVFQNFNLNNSIVLFLIPSYPMLTYLIKISTHNFRKKNKKIAEKAKQLKESYKKYYELLDEKDKTQKALNSLKNLYKQSA